MFKEIIILLTLSVLSVFSYGQENKICLANFSQDGVRVPVKDLIKDPTIRICGLSNYQIISYDLTLNINGVVYYRNRLKDSTLSKDNIELLKKVRDDMPRYNQLFLKNVQYRVANDTIIDSTNFHVWLAQNSDCNGKYDIQIKRYKNNGPIKYEYFICNDVVFSRKKYSRTGELIKTR